MINQRINLINNLFDNILRLDTFKKNKYECIGNFLNKDCQTFLGLNSEFRRNSFIQGKKSMTHLDEDESFGSENKTDYGDAEEDNYIMINSLPEMDSLRDNFHQDIVSSESMIKLLKERIDISIPHKFYKKETDKYYLKIRIVIGKWEHLEQKKFKDFWSFSEKLKIEKNLHMSLPKDSDVKRNDKFKNFKLILSSEDKDKI
eukprot:CAMPEP_0116914282 /NCGR_PEP_ID=MMETSP0467-20121206/17232_1 /TAXON_ID=283647 /ORGANISM="Mesodinium pulex, Strain SPMC105" /LENGTH=201 /DNA_ID=CAMNT_0004590709 /DNA_START=1055 /DNA_END=1660 /DNA_ORIENTATION=-